MGGPVAGKSQLWVINWAVLEASRLDLVSGSFVAGFPRTSSAWAQLSAHIPGMTQSGGAEGRGCLGQWVETTLALLVAFLVKGLAS